MTPMNYTLHGILQARILEWVAVVFSTGSSRPRNRSQVSCMEGGFFTSWATSEVWDLLWIFTNITSWGGKGENRTNTSTYLHRFTNYLHKFMNQENEPIWIMQIWKLTTTKSSGNNCGLEKNNDGSHGKQFACNAGDSGLISGLARVPGQGNGNSLQYSGLECPQTEQPGRLESIAWLTVPQGWVTDTTENKAQPKRQLHLRQKRGTRQKEFSFSQVALSLEVSVVSDSEPVWLLWPWDSPGKNTAVGNHSLL